MSDKDQDRDKSTETNTDTSDAPRPSTLSLIPAMDLSLDAVTVPPPPVSGGAALSIPRAPRLPTDAKAAAPAKKKRSEDDIFSIFDVEANTASDDIPVSVQTFDKKPEPAPEKPKSQLGSRTEEREVTRSRQIPIDQDLFNLSVGLFSSSEKSTLVAPDMSALTGLSGPSPKETPKPTLEALLPDIPAAPVAPLDSLELLAASKSSVPEAPKPKSPSSNRAGLFIGIAAAILIAGGAFLFMNKGTETTEPTAAVQAPPTSTESGLDTRPGQTAQGDEARVGASAADKPKDDPEAAAKPATTNAPGTPANAAGDKPTVAANDPGKPTAGKPSEPDTTAKPAEPEAPEGPSKAQSLAEAMAAAQRAPASPPASNEFNKSAASSALNGAAGAAAGCKAPGDPSGVARVSVTFAPSGKATRAVVNGAPFGGTATGSCVAAAFRNISVPAFSGDPVTVSKSVSIR